MLIIASRLKDYVRAKSGYNTSDRVLAPLYAIVRRICDEAIRNAQREGRRSAHTVRRALAQLGYQETISFSFVEERWERDFSGNDDPILRWNACARIIMRNHLAPRLADASEPYLE